MGAGRRGWRRRTGPIAVQESLFEIEAKPGVRYYRQILDALTRSGFADDAPAAEGVASRLLGTVWASEGPPRDGGVEETFGLGLVDYARQRRTPTSVILLRTLQVVATIREVRESAAAAADAMITGGLPQPEWISQFEVLPTGRCWAYEDAFGDMTSVICEYERQHGDVHAIMIQVDHAMFSTASEISVIEDVDATVRDLQNATQTTDPTFAIRLVDPPWARALLERAFTRTDLIDGVQVGHGFAELRALALVRLRALPDAPGVLQPEPRQPGPDERQALVDEFLGSPEGRAIPDRIGAERIARLIAEYASAYDPVDMARVSPAKWEIFVSDWLPRRITGGPALRAIIADVVRAWSAWAARRRHLAEPMRDMLSRAVEEITRGAALDT